MMLKLDDLELKRSADLDRYMTEQGMLHWDDPAYKYLFLGDYYNIKKVRVDWGWHDDAFEICASIRHAKRIGYVNWYHSRRDDKVDGIAVFVEPEYIGKGYGAMALLKLVQYLFFVRNIRKIGFSVCEPNVQTLAMYRRFVAVAGREVGTKLNEFKLFDGTCCNAVLFEVLKQELLNTDISDFYDLVVKNEG